MKQYHFTTVISQEGKWYVARCLELGVVSQGKSIEEAQKNLKEAMDLFLEDVPSREMQRYQTTPSFISTVEYTYA